jgi:hypothetical protein
MTGTKRASQNLKSLQRSKHHLANVHANQGAGTPHMRIYTKIYIISFHPPKGMNLNFLYQLKDCVHSF